VNALRRILLAVYSVILLAALGGMGVLAWNQDEQLDLDMGDLNLQAFVTSGDNAKWVFTAVLAGIGVLALVTLLIALWPRRSRHGGALRIRQSDGGTIEVTSSAIEALIKDELESLPEVQTVKPRVSLSGGAVDTYLDAQIEPSASIAHTTRLIGETVDETLREQLGVTAVRRPVVRISYDEMAARPVPAKRARGMPPPSPELRPQREAAPVADAPTRNDGDHREPREASVVAGPVAPGDPDRPPEAPRFVSSEGEESPNA
jgi:hypothetical protein